MVCRSAALLLLSISLVAQAPAPAAKARTAKARRPSPVSGDTPAKAAPTPAKTALTPVEAVPKEPAAGRKSKPKPRPAPLPLAERIRRVIDSTPAGRLAYWGIKAVDLQGGKTLFELNADHFFVPASNTKLFSTALALSRLGPDYRFQTIVTAPVPPDAGGVIGGDLRLIGGGDPSLSARLYPYKKDSHGEDPLAAVEQLAAQISERGVRSIRGDIVGDDTAWPWEPYPIGWAIDDMLWEYGAPVTALTINDNAFSVVLKPGGAVGEPALLTVAPPLDYFTIRNRVTTGDPDRVAVERAPGSRELTFTGTIPAGDHARREILAIDDPALYAAMALKSALERRGIAVTGEPRAEHRSKGHVWTPPAGVELARRVSPPLVELVQVVNKVSQNLHAELMLREAGRVRQGEASREAALEELKLFLAEAGIDKTEYHFVDASGLSRLTLVTPAALVRLLVSMHGTPVAEAWHGLMPVGGDDGTLSKRFRGLAGAGQVHAKTGSLTHVSALSGYADSAKRGRVAFSIIVNNYNVPASEIRTLIDRIAIAFTE